MTGNELLQLFRQGGKRSLLIGNENNGVIAGLDLEGRLYFVYNGEVINRVNTAAVLGITTRKGYLNPGGDGLWPAPEGTCYGYQYATGSWRVPPGLAYARFLETAPGVIEAEVELINAQGIGLPTLFRRMVELDHQANTMTVKVTESIRYLGAQTWTADKIMLAPWTLCQFDCTPDCEVVFPATKPEDVWDLYDPSDDQRYRDGALIRTHNSTTSRYQLGLAAPIAWIELRHPGKQLKVRRSALALPPDRHYIDIADAPPQTQPSPRGVCYSIYSDPAGFMEIEATGGAANELTPGLELSVTVITTIDRL